MKKKVLLFGYSRANFGDDLFVYILAKRYQDIQFSIHIKEPKYKRPLENLENINFIEEERNVDLVKIEEFDAFIYVGGSIFMESEYARHEAKEFNYFIKECNKQGKPFFYMTCNFGPYQTQEYLNMIRENFKLCQGVSFRDKPSYELFKDIPSVCYAPDMAFAYDFNQLAQKKERKTIGISVIDLSIREKLKDKEEIYKDYINRIIIKFAKRGYKVSLLSFCQFEEDEKAIAKIKEMIPKQYLENVEELFYQGDIEEFLKEYSKIKYMVCTRFHSMILSMIVKQKIYNLYYSNKTQNVIKDYELFRRFDNIADISYDIRLKKYHFKKASNQKVQNIKEKAQGQFTKFEQWLKNS
ncbi:MAG: polysaccharide pyruvyl transferase family protein [Clostridia bacterium]|nr:polysaccharide pyruvyl transferase family protein [Clostridia bacterium]